MKVRVSHHVPVWDTTTFEIEVDDMEELHRLIKEGVIDEIKQNALDTDNADFGISGGIDTMQSEWEFHNDQGKLLHTEEY